jgi:antitoxin component HigA of HigAB toxin-antitoxin module
MVDNPNVDAAKDVMDTYGLTVDDLKQKMVLFNTK